MMKPMFFFICILSHFPTIAATLTVSNTNDSGAGSLRSQVLAAQNGDFIIFDANLIASGSATILLLSEIAFSQDITITGLYNTNDTLYLSGGDANRIFSMSNNNTVILDSLCFVKGYSALGGGAVRCNNVGNLIVRNSIFTGNKTAFPYRGGGIDFQSYTSALIEINSMEVTNCIFRENNAQYGGGLASTSYLNYPNLVTINNCDFVDNDALYGGGIYYDNYTDSLTIVVPLSILNSFIDSNTADSGAGIFISSYGFSSPDAIISNCKISANSSNSSGSVLYACYSETDLLFEILNTEFEDNLCVGLLLYNNSTAANVFTTKVTNSTFANNQVTGGASAIFGNSSTPNRMNLEIAQSTFDANKCTNLFGNCGVISMNSSNPLSKLKLKNVTLTNTLNNSGSAINSDFSSVALVEVSSSIIALNEPRDFRPAQTIMSDGFNFFSDTTVLGSIGSDQFLMDANLLQLSPLDYHGDTTKTRLPLVSSVLVNAGNPMDNVLAQNGVLVGIRDAGAGESNFTTNTSGLKIEENVTVQLFPNPTSAWFIVSDLQSKKIQTIHLKDLNGQVLKTWNSKEIKEDKQYSIEEFNKGIYFVSIDFFERHSSTSLKIIKR